MTLDMAIELESTNSKVNAISYVFTRTNLNGYEGTETVEEGAAEAVRFAMIDLDGPTGTLLHTKREGLPWRCRVGAEFAFTD